MHADKPLKKKGYYIMFVYVLLARSTVFLSCTGTL